MPQLLIFGDSDTYGFGDIEGGWVAKLRRYLDDKIIKSNFELYYLTYNLGVSGDTSTDLLDRIKNEIEPRLKDNEEAIILIAIGVNDTALSKENNSNRVPIDKYKKNIEKIIKISKKFSNKIITIGLLPTDESKTNPVHWSPDISYLNEEIKKYDTVLKEVSKNEEVIFIDIFSKMEEKEYKNLIVDGLHFGKEGHEYIYNIIIKELTKNKII